MICLAVCKAALLTNLLLHLLLHLTKAFSKGPSSQKKGYYQPENELKSKIGQEKVEDILHGMAKISSDGSYCFLVKTGGLPKFAL